MGTIGNKHLKAQDYQQEYQTLHDSLTIIVVRIEIRFLVLCKKYPDVPLYKKPSWALVAPDSVIYARDINPKVVSEMNTQIIIDFIGTIEKYIKNKSPKDTKNLPIYNKFGKIND
jgi:hypothetical protein